MNNPIFLKGMDIARWYYCSQNYFKNIILLVECIANFLEDKGFVVSQQYGQKGRMFFLDYYDYNSNRNAHLPKNYRVEFSKKGIQKNINEQYLPDLDKYVLYLRFFDQDPSGQIPWVPLGYFSRISVLPGKNFEQWKVCPKISETVRPLLLEPTEESFYQTYSEPWPQELEGEGVHNTLQYIIVVPFPLAAIENSEDAHFLTSLAVQALSQKNPDLLRKDREYRQRVWGIS